MSCLVSRPPPRNLASPESGDAAFREARSEEARAKDERLPASRFNRAVRHTLCILPATAAAPTAAAVVVRPVTPALAVAATLAVVTPAVVAAQCSRMMIAAPNARVEHGLFYGSAACALGALAACLGRAALRPLVLDCYWAAVCLIVLPQIVQSHLKVRPRGQRFGTARQDRDIARNAAIAVLSSVYLALRLRAAATDLTDCGKRQVLEQALPAVSWHANRYARLAMDAVCPLLVGTTFPGLYTEAQAPRVRRIHDRHWTAGAAVGATKWTARLVLPYGVYRFLR